MNLSIKTAGDLTSAYASALNDIEEQKNLLVSQREQIENTLAEYGLTESDLENIPSLIEQAESGLAQIDDGIKQID